MVGSSNKPSIVDDAVFIVFVLNHESIALKNWQIDHVISKYLDGIKIKLLQYGLFGCSHILFLHFDHQITSIDLVSSCHNYFVDYSIHWATNNCLHLHS